MASRASLELRKIYLALATSEPGEAGMMRVIDESGEDYLYPADCLAFGRDGPWDFNALARLVASLFPNHFQQHPAKFQ